MVGIMDMPVFTAHNIRLDNGVLTRPDAALTMRDHRWLISARKVLNLVFPGNKERFRIVDLGCLEGGYAVEFARMGFDVLGIEVRDENIACCKFVKDHVNLPNLQFVQDDVANLSLYGEFDAAFCCGILYHLDKPRQFLDRLAQVTKKVLILQTHYSTLVDETKFKLSALTTNESLKGRWYFEFAENVSEDERQKARWSSFNNNRSFWIKRESLIGLIYELGFSTVFEQFDDHAPNIADNLENEYPQLLRGTFLGIKHL